MDKSLRQISIARLGAVVAVVAFALVGVAAVRSGQVGAFTRAAQPTVEAAPLPVLRAGHAVNWWFVFKLNSKFFAGCGEGVQRACTFGGTVQKYKAFGQQFVFASDENPSLQQGSGCAGETSTDPLGATFDEVYNGAFNYVVWNDQFYSDPPIHGCGDNCGGPWGHSKGMLAWNAAGDGLALQVTTPSWPAAGSATFPRKTDGNTLGCVKNNDVEVSQHFFALKLI